MFLIGTANPADPVNRLLVTDLAAECIAGIRRVRDKTAALDNSNQHRNFARLRVVRMYFDEIGHARIVGDAALRGYPFNRLLFATSRIGPQDQMNFLFEFLPLILFLGTFIYKDIYAALVVLMIAMPIGLAIKYIRTKTLDKMYFWSTLFLLAAGALTLYFRNPLFLYWKPTIFYWVVAIAFFASQYVSETTLVQRFFGLVDGLSLGKITASQWKKLNLVWVAFFVAAGGLNIYVAYNFEQATWVNFKVFGLMALTFVFMLVQTLWIAKLIGGDDEQEQQ